MTTYRNFDDDADWDDVRRCEARGCRGYLERETKDETTYLACDRCGWVDVRSVKETPP